jgi:cytochrome oxidase Cu insertion factor (SCO1/SenC/PrrC family)
VLALALLCLGCQPQPPLDVYGSTPPFQLTDQTGASFSSQDLAGRAALVDFIYTHCTDACPVLSANFAQAQRKLADQGLLGTRAVLVSVSVDPVHDTPSVLNEYAQTFKADPGSWKFLTGDFDGVWDVLTGFHLQTRPPRPAADSAPPGGTELSHTTRIVLLDPQGQVRAYLNGDDATPDEMVDAVRRVVRS